MSSDFAATSAYGLQSRPTRAPVDEAPMFPETPVYARSRKSGGLAGVSTPALIGGGVVLVALAAGVFALSRPTAPEPVVSDTPVARTAPASEPLGAMTPPAAQQPVTQLQPPAATPAVPTSEAVRPAARVAAPAQAPRRAVRADRAPAPIATPDAGAAGADVSATLPAGPVPYSAIAAPNDVAPTPAEPAQSAPGQSMTTPELQATPPVAATPDAPAETPPTP